MASQISYSAALLAGLLSFVSPCVLPLVPPYLTFLAGTTLAELSVVENNARARRDIILTALVFVLGFTTVFVALGATASLFGQVVRTYSTLLGTLAGVAIIAMGLHFLGVFRLGFLYREARVSIVKPLGLWGAYVMGLAFAFGWTPCIGPILAAILTLAGSEETVAQGAGLLAVYSLGLGLPFLGAALMIEPFLRFIRHFRRYFKRVEQGVGVLLVLTGIGFLTGGMQNAAFWLLETFPALAKFG